MEAQNCWHNNMLLWWTTEVYPSANGSLYDAVVAEAQVKEIMPDMEAGWSTLHFIELDRGSSN
ncbi:MAG TPA: hypothetical protein VIV15_14575 [Anaerolineales bacterium]